MEEYTAIEVLNYFKENVGVQKTRKREYIDVRNYVIAILYYKFGYTEFELGDIFNLERSSINHAKDLPYDFLEHNDFAFKENTRDVSKKFPYIFPFHSRQALPERVYGVTIMLNKKERDLLNKIARRKSQYINSAAKNIIQEKLKTLKEWEE